MGSIPHAEIMGQCAHPCNSRGIDLTCEARLLFTMRLYTNPKPFEVTMLRPNALVFTRAVLRVSHALDCGTV